MMRRGEGRGRCNDEERGWEGRGGCNHVRIWFGKDMKETYTIDT